VLLLILSPDGGDGRGRLRLESGRVVVRLGVDAGKTRVHPLNHVALVAVEVRHRRHRARLYHCLDHWRQLGDHLLDGADSRLRNATQRPHHQVPKLLEKGVSTEWVLSDVGIVWDTARCETRRPRLKNRHSAPSA